MQIDAASTYSTTNEVKIIATGGLGDCLFLTPFIRHFKQAMNYNRIVVVCHEKTKKIFYHNPHIDQLISCKGDDLFLLGLPEHNCRIFSPYVQISSEFSDDGALSLSTERKLNANLNDTPVVRQIAEQEGVNIDDTSLELFPCEEDYQWAENLLTSLPSKPSIILATTSPLSEKEYPHEHWCKVVELLADQFNVLQLDGTKIPKATKLSPMPGIGKSAALFEQLSCYMGIDSFPMHLASACNLPAVVVWGPTNPKAYGYENHLNLRATGCSPCANTPRLRSCTDRACLELIPPEEIVGAVQYSSRLATAERAN